MTFVHQLTHGRISHRGPIESCGVCPHKFSHCFYRFFLFFLIPQELERLLREDLASQLVDGKTLSIRENLELRFEFRS